MENQILDRGDFINDIQKKFDKKTSLKINTIKLAAHEKIRRINIAQLLLIVLAIYSAFVFVAVSIASTTAWSAIIGYGFCFVIYTACAIGVKHYTKESLIIALSFFVILIFISLPIDLQGSYLFGFVVTKFFFIFYIARGIVAAIKLKDDSIELSDMGIPRQELDMIKHLKKPPLTSYHQEEDVVMSVY